MSLELNWDLRTSGDVWSHFVFFADVCFIHVLTQVPIYCNTVLQ